MYCVLNSESPLRGHLVVAPEYGEPLNDTSSNSCLPSWTRSSFTWVGERFRLRAALKKCHQKSRKNLSWNTTSNMPGIACTWSPYYQIRGHVYHKSGKMRAILSSCCIYHKKSYRARAARRAHLKGSIRQSYQQLGNVKLSDVLATCCQCV